MRIHPTNRSRSECWLNRLSCEEIAGSITARDGEFQRRSVCPRLEISDGGNDQQPRVLPSLTGHRCSELHPFRIEVAPDFVGDVLPAGAEVTEFDRARGVTDAVFIRAFGVGDKHLYGQYLGFGGDNTFAESGRESEAESRIIDIGWRPSVAPKITG